MKIFNTITELNVTKSLIKHFLCDYDCRLDGKKFNSKRKLSKDKFRYECKKRFKQHVCKKDYL